MMDEKISGFSYGNKFLKEIFTNIKKEEPISDSPNKEEIKNKTGKIQFELEIEEGRSEIIVANLNDSPSKIAKEFCQKVSLDSKYFLPLKAKISSEIELRKNAKNIKIIKNVKNVNNVKNVKNQDSFLLQKEKNAGNNIDIFPEDNIVKSKVDSMKEIVEITPNSNRIEKIEKIEKTEKFEKMNNLNNFNNNTIKENTSEEGIISSSEENIELINPNFLNKKSTAFTNQNPKFLKNSKEKDTNLSDRNKNQITKKECSNYQVIINNDEANIPLMSSETKTKVKVDLNDSNQNSINNSSPQKSGVIITKRHTNKLHRIHNIENQELNQMYKDNESNVAKEIHESNQNTNNINNINNINNNINVNKNKNEDKNGDSFSPSKLSPQFNIEKNRSWSVLQMMKNYNKDQVKSNIDNDKNQNNQINRELNSINRKGPYFEDENSPLSNINSGKQLSQRSKTPQIVDNYNYQINFNSLQKLDNSQKCLLALKNDVNQPLKENFKDNFKDDENENFKGNFKENENECTFKPHSYTNKSVFKFKYKYKKSPSISIGEHLYSQRNNSPNKIKQQKEIQIKELNENSSKIHLLNKSEQLFYKKKQKSFRLIFNLLSDNEEKISLYRVNWKNIPENLRKLIENPLHGILEETNDIDFEQFEKCLNIIFMTLPISEKYFLLNAKSNIKASKTSKTGNTSKTARLNQSIFNFNSPNLNSHNLPNLPNLRKQKELNDYLCNNKHFLEMKLAGMMVESFTKQLEECTFNPNTGRIGKTERTGRKKVK